MNETGGDFFYRVVRQAKSVFEHSIQKPKTVEKKWLTRLLDFYLILDSWASIIRSETGVEGRPFLPENPIVRLDNDHDLVATATLRADRIFNPRTANDTPDGDFTQQKRYYLQGADSVSAAKELFQKGSLIVLFVPGNGYPEGAFTSESKFTNTGYDITVLYCLDDGRIVKLRSPDEMDYLKNRRVVDDTGRVTRQKNDVRLATTLEETEVADGKYIIWQAQTARGAVRLDSNQTSEVTAEQFERFWQLCRNQTVLYRFDIIERRKRKFKTKKLRPVKPPNLKSRLVPVPVDI